VALRPEYLFGASARSYAASPKAAFSLVDEAVAKDAKSRARRDIGGDKQRINSLTVEYENLDLSYVLAPIWTSAFYDQGRTFNVKVNGRTGKVTGHYPKSKPRLMTAVLAAAAAIAAVVTFGIISNHNSDVATAKSSVCFDASQAWDALQRDSAQTITSSEMQQLPSTDPSYPNGFVSDGNTAGNPYRALVQGYQTDFTAGNVSAATGDLQRISATCTAAGNGSLVSNIPSPSTDSADKGSG
jgi:hypothetical protein